MEKGRFNFVSVRFRIYWAEDEFLFWALTIAPRTIFLFVKTQGLFQILMLLIAGFTVLSITPLTGAQPLHSGRKRRMEMDPGSQVSFITSLFRVLCQ